MTGFPLVARCDVYWPQYAEASGNHQYIHLNDTLVAPIHTKDGTDALNVSTRSVWLPPGSWQDAWSGAVVTGPKTMSVTQACERIPLWHRKGGLTVLASTAALRVDEQDWSELTLEAFPHVAMAAEDEMVTRRFVVRKETESSGSNGRTMIEMMTMMVSNSSKLVRFTISAAADGVTARAWVLRVHLEPGTRVNHAVVDGGVLGEAAPFWHLAPIPPPSAADYAPFGGKGARPAPLAGHIAELHLPTAAAARAVELTIASV